MFCPPSVHGARRSLRCRPDMSPPGTSPKTMGAEARSGRGRADYTPWALFRLLTMRAAYAMLDSGQEGSPYPTVPHRRRAQASHVLGFPPEISRLRLPRRKRVRRIAVLLGVSAIRATTHALWVLLASRSCSSLIQVSSPGASARGYTCHRLRLWQESVDGKGSRGSILEVRCRMVRYTHKDHLRGHLLQSDGLMNEDTVKRSIF